MFYCSYLRAVDRDWAVIAVFISVKYGSLVGLFAARPEIDTEETQ